MTSLRYNSGYISITSMVPLFVSSLSLCIGSRFYSSNLSLYREPFNVSIGLVEASCAGLEGSSGFFPRAE